MNPVSALGFTGLQNHLYLRKSTTKKEIKDLMFLFRLLQKLIRDDNLDKCITVQKLEETNKMIILMTLDGLEYQEISEVVMITEETFVLEFIESEKSLTQCTK
jgi:RNA polymerase sigma-70 factor (ECF subfamily)